ncbi:MAG: NAD-dependent epimerase/dehydratase family protein [Nitrososphaerales archaeon]
MVILVTGGAGFIGSHIVDKLCEKGYTVRVFDLAEPHRSDVEWVKGDLLNMDDLFKAFKDVEYVYHLAAIADVNIALTRPELCLQVNEVGTLNLLRAAHSFEVTRVILASTTWVYNRAEGIVTEETPIPPPDHLYTASKIGQENLLIAWNKHFGIPYTILRFDIPYGERMRANMAIAIFVKRAINRESITIYGDGEQGRCFINISDLSDGCIAAMHNNGKNQIVNLAGKEFITINRIIKELKKTFGELKVNYEPPRPGDFKGVVVSIDKAKKLFGWEPKVEFSEGLKRYIESVMAPSSKK